MHPNSLKSVFAVPCIEVFRTLEGNPGCIKVKTLSAENAIKKIKEKLFCGSQVEGNLVQQTSFKDCRESDTCKGFPHNKQEEDGPVLGPGVPTKGIDFTEPSPRVLGQEVGFQ